MKDNPTPPEKESNQFTQLVEQLQKQNELAKVAADNEELSGKLQNKLLNDSNKLSSEQREQIEGLVKSLEGNKLKDLENQKEDKALAENILEALEGILENTEDLGKLSAKETGAAGLLAIPVALAALGAGFVVGVSESLVKLTKAIGKGLMKGLKPLVNGVLKGWKVFYGSIFKGLNKLTGGMAGRLAAAVSDSFKNLGTKIKTQFKSVIKSAQGIFKSIGGFFKNIKNSFKAGFAGLKVFRTATGQFGKVGFFGKIGGLVASLIKPFKAIGTVIGDIKRFILGPFESIGKSIDSLKSALPGGGGGISKTIQPAVDSLKRVFDVVKSVAKTALNFGRVLGRLFVPISIIMSIFDSVKGAMKGFDKYKDKGFVEGLIGGLFGGISGLLEGLIGLPLDLLKDGVSWIAGKLGFENFSEQLDSFSFKDLIANLFTSITDTIVGFIGNIKESIADIGIMDTVKNIGLDLMKIVKKIAMFPVAVAAGALSAIAAAMPGGQSPSEAFMSTFNDVFTAGDSAIDSVKVKGDGLNENGEEIKSTSAENELSKSDQPNNAANVISSVSSDNSTNRGGDTIIMTNPKPSRVRGGHYATR